MTNSIQDIRTTIFRSLLVAVMIVCGVGESWGKTYYVFYNSTHGYLYNNSGTLTANTTFNGANFIWYTTNDLSTTAQTIRSYSDDTKYLNVGANNGGTVSLGTSTTARWQVRNTYLATRSSNSSYYLKSTSTTSFQTATDRNSGNLYTPYSVTISSNDASITDPTVTGSATTLSSVGATATFTASSSYTPAYTTYTFNNTTYYSTDSGASATQGTAPTASSDGITYSWSLSSELSSYASISTDGTVTVESLPAGTDAVGTVICKASKTVNGVIIESSESTESLTIEAKSLSGYYRLQFYNSTSYYLNVSSSNYNSDSNTPYLNTSTSTGNDALWELAKVGNYFYMVHVMDGKYVVANETSQTQNAVHLETLTTPGTTAQFSITENGTDVYNIIPNGASGVSFNSWGGAGNNIGLYSSSDGGSKWYLNAEDWTVPVPTITIESGNVTLSHTFSYITLYYTTDGTDPTTSSTKYTGSFNVELGTTVKAIAVYNSIYSGQKVSSVVSSKYRNIEYEEITSLSQITDANGAYRLKNPITDASDVPAVTTFSGYFDGNFQKITGRSAALFDKLTDATVYNVILDNVSISGSGNRGAIANEASGNARIYNCGVLATGSTFEFDNTYTSKSTISGTNAGSIVGVISGNTRVLNCYSYADVSGSTYGAGIVGRSTGTWINTTTVQSTQCFVMNCMFYGNIVSGDTKSPIVNASTNDNYSMYSYFRYKSMSNVSSMTQNGALAIQEDIWLKRFAFFQAAVNNHRDLAALYCFDDATRISEIAQWYIDESIAPWPILRKAGNQKSTLARVIPTTGNANEGNLITNVPDDIKKRYNMSVGTNGKLTVNYTINDKTGSVDLPITDMDFEHYDYTWGKVVLPFINEFEGWTRDYTKVCVGWEITGMTGGTTGTLTDYNYADRNCTAKDIYNATSNPILFAEGGNFIVPYGVTAININAHFANAFYLSDASYDCYASGGSERGTRPTTYHGQKVYNTAAAAWDAMTETTSPNDQAIVLVGNYHYTANTSGSYTGKGCTVLSVDDDNDQQPDYGWYSSVGNYRQNWPSIRWTFVPIIGAGMAQKYSSMPPGLAIPVATGWWEMTETTLCRTFEFEISDNHRTNTDDGYGNNCYIINGGWFQQLVRCWDGTCNRLSYVKVGGNAYIKEFFHGNHSGTNLTYTLRPIVVTGGEIVSCYMTGMGSKKEVVETDNNVRFYCAGGKINKYLSAYNGYPVVNATMKVDHAYINRFFGGGTTQIARLTGSIDVTMNYSDVTFFCGGPEFGDMEDGKTVTVNTTGSTFGEFYGAGYGGTALTRITNGDGQKSPFTGNGGSRLNYNADAGGYEVSYEMENLLNGSGTALYRYYDYRAALSLATTGSVTTNATNCLFKNSFYGGGCQGKVKGTIYSTLTDCDVTGSAFGGGYKAAATTISVYPDSGNTWPSWDGTYKAFGDAVYPDAVTFTWVQGTDGTSDDTNHTLAVSQSTVDMTTMGEVTDNISITVQSDTGAATVGGSVYGGGNESSSLKNTEVKILGNTTVGGNVYGGGNQATVGGTTKVQIGNECEDAGKDS